MGSGHPVESVVRFLHMITRVIVCGYGAHYVDLHSEVVKDEEARYFAKSEKGKVSSSYRCPMSAVTAYSRDLMLSHRSYSTNDKSDMRSGSSLQMGPLRECGSTRYACMH